jgi:hypothetical protein
MTVHPMGRVAAAVHPIQGLAASKPIGPPLGGLARLRAEIREPIGNSTENWRRRTIMKAFAILIALTFAALTTAAEARGGGHYYGGGHHTSSHGGYYAGGFGSSHRGGTYHGPYGGYGRHK